MRARGFSLAEMIVVLGIMGTMLAVSIPMFRPRFAEAHLLGAARQFKAEFRLAASTAVRANVYTAIRFERRGEDVWYSVYQDGNHNGVRAVDIDAGVDRRIAGPLPLTAGAPGVRIGFNPGVPAVPPDSGLLSGDPIRFGSSDTLSFSPLGTATSGTFYLAGDAAQAAVRVTGTSARVRLMVWRGGQWIERS